MWNCCRSIWGRWHWHFIRQRTKEAERRRKDGGKLESKSELMAANRISRTLGSYEFKMHFHISQTSLFNETNINNGVPRYLISENSSKVSPGSINRPLYRRSLRTQSEVWHRRHLVSKFRKLSHDSTQPASLSVMLMKPILWKFWKGVVCLQNVAAAVVWKPSPLQSRSFSCSRRRWWITTVNSLLWKLWSADHSQSVPQTQKVNNAVSSF